MTVMQDKLKEAFDAKNNDLKSFVWKFARQSDGTQPEIKLMDATEEQLKSFYKHCKSMLYNTDKVNPGRYVLLDLIREQRAKCNVELFIRKLESGSIGNRPCPRFVLWQNILDFQKKNAEYFAEHDFYKSPISTYIENLPAEFERIPMKDVMDACIDQLGICSNKHITFSFIINLGICLSPDELKKFDAKDEQGNKISKLSLIKERLGINPNTRLIVKPGGLNFDELRSIITLRPKKYVELTSDQLTVLRNKILFRLENEVSMHALQWERKLKEINKVCEFKGITLE